MPPVVTPRGFHLGKNDPKPSPFDEFKTYFSESPGPPPQFAHWGGRVHAPWQMDGNGPDPDVTIMPAGWAGAGDCVEAGKAHALMTANYDEAGHTVPVPTADAVIEQYCAYQGCAPDQLASDPNTYDNGEDVVTSLTQWAQGAEYGVKLPFTAPVNSGSQADIQNGIALGGGLLIGIQLPQSAEDQFPNKWTWDPSSPMLGGHCVWLTGFDIASDYVALVTWGALIQCSWEFLKNTIDEAHAVVMPQAIAAGKSPTGLLIPKWEADLAGLT